MDQTSNTPAKPFCYYTIDDEQNLFEIYDDGYTNCKLYEDPNNIIIEESPEKEQKNENKENSIINNESKAQPQEGEPQPNSNPNNTEPNAEEENKIARKIAFEDPDFTKHSCWKSISNECIDFIKKLLEKDVKKRMVIEDAIKHNWFKKFIHN